MIDISVQEAELKTITIVFIGTDPSKPGSNPGVARLVICVEEEKRIRMASQASKFLYLVKV